MDLFYIRHHYLSLVRSTSFQGEMFAMILLAILFGSSISVAYEMLDVYALEVGNFFGQTAHKHSLFLMVYVFMDLSIRLIFRRPLPQLKYYVLWGEKSTQISWQYMLTSFIGLVPFLMGLSIIMIALKASEWLGNTALISILIWWFSNHYLGLFTQFSSKKVKPTFVGLVFTLLVLQLFIPGLAIHGLIIQPITPLVLLLIALAFSFLSVKSTIENRHVIQENAKGNYLDSLPTLSFKNPVVQLEWALLIRNKRTRSNLLMGLVSIIILPFILDKENEGMIVALIFFIVTGFFIIQHGVYSLGWEGSYFDFLLTNISPQTFIRTRYVFYAATCCIGLILAMIPTIIKGLDAVMLSMLFLYNLGVTIPFVLYRSTFNATKIVLTENSFMNYNGMMTGPIMVTSFLITLIPLIIYSIADTIMGSSAMYLLGLLGIIGVLLFQPLTNLVAKRYQKSRYHLSQSFKS